MRNEIESAEAPKLYLFDTSAILALTDQEEGAEEVEQLLQRAEAAQCRLAACSITLMELYYVALQEKGEDEAARLVALVKAWPLRWVYPDEKTLLQAGRLKASYRLSVADALIAAVAKLHQATLVHKDPELAALAGEVELLTLPLKKPQA
uniref:PilT domain-containing protein n=1 Tax=uncultured prokaryote TaxID=198431 RepID=H5S961_9ZZZZ|nr:PilT domain-containing protein [uncultured prokaryote]